MRAPKSESWNLPRAFVLCPPERISTLSLSGRRQKGKEGKEANPPPFYSDINLTHKGRVPSPISLKFQHEGLCFH